MSLLRTSLTVACFVALSASPVVGASTHHARTAHSGTTRKLSTHEAHSTTAHGAHSTAHGTHKKAAPRLHGQQAIEPARIIEIQKALIREHYLTGEASGQWDQTTISAMQKYQADQGWQTKLMPDSRALKKLGLGPDYSNAINAKSASFTPPPPASTIPPVVSAGFAEAAGVQ